MRVSSEVRASIIMVAGTWSFERARMLQEESSRQHAAKSFEELLKEHFNDYYIFLLNKFKNEEQ